MHIRWQAPRCRRDQKWCWARCCPCCGRSGSASRRCSHLQAQKHRVGRPSCLRSSGSNVVGPSEAKSVGLWERTGDVVDHAANALLILLQEVPQKRRLSCSATGKSERSFDHGIPLTYGCRAPLEDLVPSRQSRSNSDALSRPHKLQPVVWGGSRAAGGRKGPTCSQEAAEHRDGHGLLCPGRPCSRHCAQNGPTESCELNLAASESSSGRCRSETELRKRGCYALTRGRLLKNVKDLESPITFAVALHMLNQCSAFQLLCKQLIHQCRVHPAFGLLHRQPAAITNT